MRLICNGGAYTADQRLGFCSSYARPAQLVQEMLGAPAPAEAVRLFLEWGSLCDAPWPYRSDFAGILRDALRHVRLADVLPPADREWFLALDPVTTVYRGCQSGRERGLSWTADLKVATGFAVGRRCINAQPKLVTAQIPKEHVFAVFLDRSESEIVLDPRRLRRLTDHPAADQLIEAERISRGEAAVAAAAAWQSFLITPTQPHEEERSL